MKVIRSTIATLILSALALFTMLSIARADVTDGGHDGGGTRIQRSSREEVIAAYNWVIDSARTNRDPDNGEASWLFFAGLYTPSAPGVHLSMGSCIAHPMLCAEEIKQLPMGEGEVPVYLTTWDVLSKSRIYFEENGPCPAPDKKDAVASVSKFAIGADLCFSIPLLRRVPAQALRAQIAGVLAHEMTHLFGFGEELATEVQFGIIYNFDRILRRDGRPLVFRLRAELALIEQYLDAALNQVTDDNLADGPAFVGQAIGGVNLLLGILPDGLNDNTIPVAKPKMYPEVKQQLYSLVADLSALAFNAPGKGPRKFLEEARALKPKMHATMELVKEFIGDPYPEWK